MAIETKGSRPYTKEDQYSYKDRILKIGEELLEKMGVSSLLSEMVEDLKKDYPDARLMPLSISHDGSMYKMLEWDLQEITHGQYECNAVEIALRPLTGELVIEGNEGEIFDRGEMPRMEWGISPTDLKEALDSARQNPIRYTGPPMQIP